VVSPLLRPRIRTVAILMAALFFFISCQQAWQLVREQLQMTRATDTPSRTATEGVQLTASSQFTHPGILNHTFHLDQARQDSSSQRVRAYNQIVYAIDNLLPYPSSFPSTVWVRTPPHPPTPSESQMWSDALLAYAYALKWTRSGSGEDARRAIHILDGWADSFERIRGCSEQESGNGCPGVATDGLQRRLQAAWVAPNFAAAAEIIRHYEADGKEAGWGASNIRKFERFLEDLQVNYIETLVQGIHRGGTGWSENNWGASGLWAKMSVAIFLNRVSWYNDAVARSRHMIYNAIDGSGEVNECERSNFRDCLHPQMTLTALTFAAETSANQGDASLYYAYSERLIKGWDWVGRAFQGTVRCKNREFRCGSDQQIMPGVEVIHHHYGQIGTPSARIGSLKEQQAPYGVVTRQFIGFTSYTHPEAGN